MGQGVDRRDMAKEGKQGRSLLPPTLFLLFFVVTSLPAIEYVRRSGSPLATKPKPAVQLLASSSSLSNPLKASLALSVRREGDEPEGVDRETEVEHGDLRRGSRLDWGSSLGLGRLSALRVKLAPLSPQLVHWAQGWDRGLLETSSDLVQERLVPVDHRRVERRHEIAYDGIPLDARAVS